MRLRRFVLFGTPIVIIWSTIVFLYSSNFADQGKKGLMQIELLQDGIQEQFISNNELIRQAHLLLEQKKDFIKDAAINQPFRLSTVDSSKDLMKDTTKLPVLVMACNRISVTRCLDKLLQYRPDSDKFPIIVSQDCEHEETAERIRSYGSQLTLIQQPDQSDIQVLPKEKKFKGYFKISRHYNWALSQMFFNFNFSNVIIVEDDLDVSPDFFEYFLGTYPLIEKDPSLWCVSAWNDNGKDGLVNKNRPDLLYRTDFFPGLGWLLMKNMWLELYTKWPRAYWDDWIREPAQRKNRSCIRPEISRTKTFGKIGVSNGMYFEKHLKYIKLNEEFVPFSKMNLSYLLKENYDRDFVGAVNKFPKVNYQDLKNDNINFEGPVRITYDKVNEYKIITKKLGLMDDFRGGVPRMAYMGIVSFYYNGRPVHLTPNGNWSGYEWS